MSLPSSIDKSSMIYFDHRNLTQSPNTTYLSSIALTNGLSRKTCSLYKAKDQQCDNQNSGHLENLIHMIDLNPDAYEAAIEENYSKQLESNKQFAERIRASVAEYHMRVAVFQTLY